MKRLILILSIVLLGILPGVAQAAPGFTKIATAPTTAFTDPTCPNLSVCYYQVTTVDSAGFESIPATCGTSTLCQGGNIAVAIMPSSGTHTVALTWTAPTTTGVVYNVYRHIGPLPATALNLVVN